jgi:CDP-diacylglycerol--glycerol-3-phosphate 3-phosphatidyltransferase
MTAGGRPGRFWNVPNSLSVSRLGLAAVVCAAIEAHWFVSAMVVFAVAAVTDALDGYLARRLGQTSALGRQLDPFVDKVIVAAALIYLLPIPGAGLAPWMVTVIIVREMLVQALRSLVEGRGVAFGARWAGKLKTVLQCLAVILILAGLAYGTRELLLARDLCLWSAVLLTLYSGCVYVAAAWPLLRDSELGS